MPRQPVVSVTITAQYQYDKKLFGSVSVAETTVSDFLKDVVVLSRERGVSITIEGPEYAVADKP